MDINGFSLQMIYTWWIMVAFPMFSNVFPCFPMCSNCFPYLWELAGGHWRVLKPVTWEPEHPGPGLRGYSQGRDPIRAGKCPNFTTASIYAGCGGLEHVLFFHILGIIIPTDWLIFFRGVETTNQCIYIYMYIIWDYMSMCILYVNCIYIYTWKTHQTKKTKCPMSEMSIAICFISRRLSTELGAYWKGA